MMQMRFIATKCVPPFANATLASLSLPPHSTIIPQDNAFFRPTAIFCTTVFYLCTELIPLHVQANKCNVLKQHGIYFKIFSTLNKYYNFKPHGHLNKSNTTSTIIKRSFTTLTTEMKLKLKMLELIVG